MTASGRIAAGTVLGGRYRIGRQLAAGGMGEVYLAEDERLGRVVVVKVPGVRFYEKPALRERLLAESREQKAIDHPHIVRILDVGTHGPAPYLVLPYLEEGTLEERRVASPDGRIAPESVPAWLESVAKALDFLHGEKELVHRDVKPANILFDRTGRAHLSDFGVARSIATDEDLVEDVSLFGSPAYMAPEQIVHGTLTGAADQYSLAVVVYQCLSGHLPHEGKTSVEIMLKKQREAPVPISESVPALAPGAAAAIMKALDRDYWERHASCRAFAAAFKSGLSEHIVLDPIAAASPVRAPVRSRRPVEVPRWKVVTARVCVVAMLLIAVFLGRVVARRQHESRKTEARAAETSIVKPVPTMPVFPEILVRSPPPGAVVNPERLRVLGRVRDHYEHATLHILGEEIPLTGGRFDHTLSITGRSDGPLRLDFVYRYGVYEVGDIGRIRQAREVLADSEPPRMSVGTVPEQDDEGVSWVSGAIEEENFATLTIDGNPIEPDDGSFRHRIDAGESGWVQVRYVARDGAENETVITRTFVPGGAHIQVSGLGAGGHLRVPTFHVLARVKAPDLEWLVVLTILYRPDPKDTPIVLTRTDLPVGVGGLVDGTIGLGEDGWHIARLELTAPDGSVAAEKRLGFVLDTTSPFFSDVEINRAGGDRYRVSGRVRDEHPRSLSVNGKSTVIGQDGSFSVEAVLVEGALLLEAADKAGNMVQKLVPPP